MAKAIKPSERDFQKLGKTLSKVLAKDYMHVAENWRRFIWLSFVRGIFIGLGGVIGATLVLAVLLWVLGGFDQVPLLNNLAEKIRNTIETRR